MRAEAPAGAALAALAGGPVAAAGPLREQRAWSTIKVPLLVAYLQRVRGAPSLSAEGRADARAAITVSANEPANRLFLALAGREGGIARGVRAIERVLRRGGDETTRVTALRPDGRRTFTWLGQTPWRLVDGVRWYRALARGTVAGRADTRFVIGLMRSVEGSEWGVRTALPAAVPLAYKVGIGNDPSGAVEVEQYAIVGRGAGACVVALAARGGQEAGAKATADRLARVVTRPVRSGRGCRQR